MHSWLDCVVDSIAPVRQGLQEAWHGPIVYKHSLSVTKLASENKHNTRRKDHGSPFVGLVQSNRPSRCCISLELEGKTYPHKFGLHCRGLIVSMARDGMK